MKLKRVIAKGLLAGMVLSTVLPAAAIETKSYSVDTTLKENTKKYEEVVSIEKLEVPTVTASAVQMMYFQPIKEENIVPNTTETEKTEEESLVVYTTEYLNVREKPSEEAEIVDVLPPNTEIYISELVSDDWFSFDYEDNTYFINAGYVTPIAPENEDDIVGIEESEEYLAKANAEVEETGSFEEMSTKKKKTKKVVKKKTTRKKTTKIVKQKKNVTKKSVTNKAKYSASYFKKMGVINWGGYKWTWYSERVLPGGGLKIPGRNNDSNGYICDENNYICLASSTLKKGTIIDTPFGKQGKIYDSGCAAGILDVYVGW